jgi:predicted RNase H-like nuclease (RuvC/YqgF family)
MVAMANRQSVLPTIKRPSCEDPSTVLYLYERVEKSVEIIEGLKAQNRSLLETNQQLQVKIGELEAEVDRVRGTLAIHVVTVHRGGGG